MSLNASDREMLVAKVLTALETARKASAAVHLKTTYDTQALLEVAAEDTAATTSLLAFIDTL